LSTTPGWIRSRPASRSGSEWWAGGRWNWKWQKSLDAVAPRREQRRPVIAQLVQQGYAAIVVGDVLDYPRSTYYHTAKPVSDDALRTAIREVAGQWPRYGYRRVTAQLRRQGWPVNRKRIQRLMRLLDLPQKIKARKRRTTNSPRAFPRYPNLVEHLAIPHPDQVWVCDITWIHLRREDVYLAVIRDVFTRSIRGWPLSRSLDHSLTLEALHQALQTHCPEIHHSDQGVQYAATAYTETVQAQGIQISMADVGAAWQNGYAERLVRTIKDKEVDLSDYDDYHDAVMQLGQFLNEVYMHKRIHSSLGSLPPGEFEAQWQTQQASAPSIP
jgi:transposase InsO family protein